VEILDYARLALFEALNQDIWEMLITKLIPEIELWLHIFLNA
jgi:hypothetical protein